MTAHPTSLLPMPSPWEAPSNTAESLPLPGFTQAPQPFTSRNGGPYLAPRVQWGQDDVVGVSGGRGAGQRGQGVLAPTLGQLGVALPAAEQQPIRAVTHQVAAVALLRPGLGPVGAVLLPLIGG